MEEMDSLISKTQKKVTFERGGYGTFPMEDFAKFNWKTEDPSENSQIIHHKMVVAIFH
jgi:hypothetical protein